MVTGAAGLVGSECCKLFATKGDQVVSVDNYMRGKILGKQGDTRIIIHQLLEQFSNIRHVECDIRDTEVMAELMFGVNAIIHCASQPSHPRSIEIPLEDFSINAYGTLNLLELTRDKCPEAVLVFCSTNKVYGDNPNKLAIVEQEKRYDYAEIDGIDESLSIDYCMHTPFGVSKVAADLYVQEYARLYGLKTGVFRMGCITGGAVRAVEMHNWEPYFMRKNLREEVLTIYGYKGKQVRDIIHAKDIAILFEKFIESPYPGEVYNIGGGRENSISLLEAIDLIESITHKKMKYKFGPAREGDHIVYISDISKARRYFNWDIIINIETIFQEIYEAVSREEGK